MDTELKNADFRSIMGKNGEEDTIIVQQRFLNLFRQLHIFNKAQKEDFNKKLLNLNPQIRDSFMNLPGGSLLQQYINELEQKAGVAHTQVAHIKTELKTNKNLNLDDEIAKAKILATALAEAQLKTMPQMAPQQPIMPTPPLAGQAQLSESEFKARMDLLKNEMLKAKEAKDTSAMKRIQQEYLRLKEMKPLPIEPAKTTSGESDKPSLTQGASVVLNADFAENLAKAFAEAILPFEEKRQKETLDLSKSLKDTQLEIAHSLMESKSEISRALSRTPTVVTTTSEDGSSSTIVKENNAEIAQAIKESQLEMAKMILNHNAIAANNNANNIQINNVPPQPSAMQTEEMINSVIKAQMEMFKDVVKTQTEEISSVISMALRESQEMSTQTIIEAIKAFQSENLEILKSYQKQTANEDAKNEESIIEKLKNSLKTVSVAVGTQKEEQKEENIAPKSLPPVAVEVDKAKQFVPQAPKPKKKVKKPVRPKSMFNDIKIPFEQFEKDLDNQKTQEILDDELFGISSSLPETSAPAEQNTQPLEEDDDWVWEELPENEEAQTTDKEAENEALNESVNENEPITEEPENIENFEGPEDKGTEETSIPQPLVADAEEDIEPENAEPIKPLFEEEAASEHTENPFAEEELQTENPSNSDDNQEWEYVEEDDNSPAEAAQAPTEDEEWEYVEEDESSPAETAQAPTDDEEWEYVEEDENSPADAAQTPTDDAEWEYVEEDESSPAEAAQAPADDAEWEWEYVEEDNKPEKTTAV